VEVPVEGALECIAMLSEAWSLWSEVVCPVSVGEVGVVGGVCWAIYV